MRTEGDDAHAGVSAARGRKGVQSANLVAPKESRVCMSSATRNLFSLVQIDKCFIAQRLALYIYVRLQIFAAPSLL